MGNVLTKDEKERVRAAYRGVLKILQMPNVNCHNHATAIHVASLCEIIAQAEGLVLIEEEEE